MEITQVKIFPVQEDKLKAFVSVVFDQCFMVNDIKVIQGKDGLFLSMPSRRKKSGEFKDVAHPLNNETRRILEERVLSEYRREVDDRTPRRPDRAEDVAGPPASLGSERPHGSPRNNNSERTAPASIRPPGAAPGVAAAPSDAGSQVAAASAAASREKTLEEVQEMHLSDSFWSVS